MLYSGGIVGRAVGNGTTAITINNSHFSGDISATATSFSRFSGSGAYSGGIIGSTTAKALLR